MSLDDSALARRKEKKNEIEKVIRVFLFVHQ